MSNWIVTRDVVTPTFVAPTSTATGFRANDLLIDTQPFRVWRSTDTTGEAIVWDFGTAVDVAGVLVNNANFTSSEWYAGSGPSTFENFLGTRAVPFDELVQRYKGLHVVSMPTPRRYFKFIPLAPLEAFFELGAVTFVTPAGMQPIGYAWGFPDWRQVQALDVLEASAQVSVRGRSFLRLGLGQPNIFRGASDADMIHHRNFIAAAKHTPHVLSANRDTDDDGTTRLAYLMVAEGEETAHGETKRTFSPEGFVLREVIA